jgi:hypothetical protein
MAQLSRRMCTACSSAGSWYIGAYHQNSEPSWPGIHDTPLYRDTLAGCEAHTGHRNRLARKSTGSLIVHRCGSEGLCHHIGPSGSQRWPSTGRGLTLRLCCVHTLRTRHWTQAAFISGHSSGCFYLRAFQCRALQVSVCLGHYYYWFGNAQQIVSALPIPSLKCQVIMDVRCKCPFLYLYTLYRYCLGSQP